MKRRTFLNLPLTCSAPLIVPDAARAAAGLAEPDPVRAWTAALRPALALSQVGFRPSVSKTLVFRAGGEAALPRVQLFDFRKHNTQKPGEPARWLTLAPARCDFGPAATADVSDLAEGRYQLHVDLPSGDEWSAPFFVGPLVWRRLLHLAMNYYRSQRCGVGVPGVHPPCHLDDAVIAATGKHVNAVGGWHDASDVRKQPVTMLNGIALGHLLRDLPRQSADDPQPAEIRAELKHGNAGFLGQQDSDGKLWDQIFDDNRWSDNKTGNADDRKIENLKTPFGSLIFAALQGHVAQAFARSDAAYARRCAAAGLRALAAFPDPLPRTTALAWQLNAAVELHRATGVRPLRDRAVALARDLLARQVIAKGAAQTPICGHYRDADGAPPVLGEPPECEVTGTALPSLALLALIDLLPRHEDASRWRDAVTMNIEGLLYPLAARNAYEIVPLSVYEKAPTSETYRSLGPHGSLSYRYFYPSRLRKWWQGANCHFAAHATLLARAAARVPGLDGRRCANLATRQIEWIVGRNPFGASLMTGVGIRHISPYQGMVGYIQGGVSNGPAGNDADEPILDTHNSQDWRTTEYWGPHVSYLVTAITALEGLG